MNALTLSVDEMSGIFRALCADAAGYTLEDALNETVPLARARGIDAAGFSAQLEAAGIRCTENFRQWLDQKFGEAA